MSEDARGVKLRNRVLFVANPSSSSEDSEEDRRRDMNNQYNQGNLRPNRFPPRSSNYSHYPTPLTTNLLPTQSSQHNSSYPSLSSPSSTGSPATEEPNPPSSGSGISSSRGDLTPDTATSREPIVNRNSSDRGPNDSRDCNTSRTGRLLQTLKSPFHSRQQHRLHTDTTKRPRASPTASTPDSSSSLAPPSIVPPNILIVVTTDSDWYVAVDVGGARTAAVVRECIFNKLNIQDDEQLRFAIYQTEMGAFAIGDALSDDKLFSICRDHGDSKGTLKFFVSHSSAAVHEQPFRPHSPTATLPPPTLPPNLPPPAPSYHDTNPLRIKRRSRNESISSIRDIKEETAAGYEADLETTKASSHPTHNPSGSQQSLNHLIPSNTPPSPHAPRRPSGPLPRPASPSLRPPRSNTPPPLGPPTNGEMQGNLPKQKSSPPLAPPLSPNRSHFFSPDERGAVASHHDRSGSDVVEREQASKQSESTYLTMGKIWRARQPQGGARLRAEPSREALSSHSPRKDSRKKVLDQDDSLGRTDSWVWVQPSGSRLVDQVELSPPHELRRTNTHSSRSNLRQPSTPVKVISPHTGRTVAIPSAPRQPPPAVPSISEHRPPASRTAGKPLPPHLVVSWKGETKGEPQRRLTKGAKSMDNLRANAYGNHPSTLQPGGSRRINAQLPISRQPAGVPYTPSSPGLALSYDTRTSVRPLPIQGTSISSNMIDRDGGYASYASRGTLHGTLHSPNHEPYPRPSSAIGDAMISPTNRYNRHLQSPTYTHDQNDPDNRLRGTSPGRTYPSTNYSDSRVENGSDRSSDIMSGGESSHTSPRTPISPNIGSAFDRDKVDGASRHTKPSDFIPEATITQEDRGLLPTIASIGNQSSESTLLGRGTSSDDGTIRVSLHPSSPRSTSPELVVQDDSDSDSEDYMFQKPLKTGDAQKANNDRPPLKVQTSSDTGPTEKPNNITNLQASSSTHLPFPPLPSSLDQRIPTPPKPHRRAPSVPRDKGRERERRAARGSTFTDAESSTWAPRPPPEDVYDRLEDFFPEHDLDKPVIDANSGGTSPTTAEPAATLPPPATATMMSSAEKHSRMRAKKSIRIVAEEHKKLIGRTIRGESTSHSNVMRKRSTKLWGSKLEEVTTLQAKGQPAVPTLPESPSGGPTTFKWVRGELIGKGTYGRVYLALNMTTGEMIAVKQVEMPRTMSDKNDARQRAMVQALKMEIETLKDLDHPNIVQYLGFEETPSNLSIFLEYVPGGSIGSCLLKHGKFDEMVTRHFTKQILGGLEYLHSKGILHRDLKADNILVEMSGVCKISDFGISKRTDDADGGAFTAMQGTVFWMAPEVINTRKKGYNSKIDIWSVGCVVLEMWAGMRPWMGDEVVAVMFKLYQSKQPPPVPDDVDLSELANDFRLRCFAINPEDRPTAAELRKHQYLILPPDWVFTDFR